MPCPDTVATSPGFLGERQRLSHAPSNFADLSQRPPLSWGNGNPPRFCAAVRERVATSPAFLGERQQLLERSGVLWKPGPNVPCHPGGTTTICRRSSPGRRARRNVPRLRGGTTTRDAWAWAWQLPSQRLPVSRGNDNTGHTRSSRHNVSRLLGCTTTWRATATTPPG